MDKRPEQGLNPIEQIFFGDRPWGVFRVCFVFAGLSLIGLTVFANNQQVFFIEPRLLPAQIIWALKIEFLRYLIVPVAVIINIILLGGLYVQDIYELESYRDALRFLIGALFSLGLSTTTIKDGHADLPEGEINLLDMIGGPGWIYIMPGNAVLLESLKRPTRVLTYGLHFIPRFEKIKTIIDLKDQEHSTKKVSPTTKDGIVLNVGDIRFRYRIASDLQGSRRLKRSSKNPYPFSEEAVVKYAYRRSVSDKGVAEWNQSVAMVINSTISDYINQNRADDITAPNLGSDPREKIKAQINSPQAQNRLKDIGTELVWVDIGFFQMDMEEVDRKRLEVWEAKWSGSNAVIRAQSEGERIAVQEQGRAEGQANLLTSIVNSLREAGIDEKDDVNLANIILARTAQILESTTSIYQRDDE